MILPLLGIALAVGGIAALYRGWKKSNRSWPLVASGWVLIVLSLFAWAQTSGIDKGPAKGIVAFMLLALLALLALFYRAPVKQRRVVNRDGEGVATSDSGKVPWASAAYSLLMLAIACGLAAMALSTAIFMICKSTGLEHTANLTLTMFLFPMLWAGLAVMVGYVRKSVLKTGMLLGLILVSALIILAFQ